jgi:hypothetical protein
MWISVNGRIPIVDLGILVKTEVGSTNLPIRKKRGRVAGDVSRNVNARTRLRAPTTRLLYSDDINAGQIARFLRKHTHVL